MKSIRHRALITALAVLASMSSRSAPPAPENGKALLLGTDTAKVRVLFRSLDGGPVLWTTSTSLGTKLSVDPGHHALNVMCEFKSPGMTRMTQGNADIDV